MKVESENNTQQNQQIIEEINQENNCFEIYKCIVHQQDTSSQQKYEKYQNILKLNQNLMLKKLEISEKLVILILEQHQSIIQIAKELQKQNEYMTQWSQFIQYISQGSEKYTNKTIFDEIQYQNAESYFRERNFKKAAYTYTQIIHINEKRVPNNWIPSIIETFKKQNAFTQISQFCLQQQKIRDQNNEDLSYYLLIHILGRKVVLPSVLNYIETKQIHRVIDEILNQYLNKQFIINIYRKSVKIYDQFDTQQEEDLNNQYEEASKFFYSLIQAYANILKQQNYPNYIYIEFIQKLKRLCNQEEKNIIYLEIAQTYSDLKEIESSITYYEKYLLKNPNNLGIVFDLYYQYQSSEDVQKYERMYDFFKVQLIHNPELTVYYSILIQNNNMSLKQLKLLIKEYLDKNMKYYQNIFKFIDVIDNTLFTQNSFFNNKDLIKSYLKYKLEKAHQINIRIIYSKLIIPQLIFQPQLSLFDLYFD